MYNTNFFISAKKYVKQTITVQYITKLFVCCTSCPENWWKVAQVAQITAQIMLFTGLFLTAVCVTLSIYNTSGQTSNSVPT